MCFGRLCLLRNWFVSSRFKFGSTELFKVFLYCVFNDHSICNDDINVVSDISLGQLSDIIASNMASVPSPSGIPIMRILHLL